MGRHSKFQMPNRLSKPAQKKGSQHAYTLKQISLDGDTLPPIHDAVPFRESNSRTSIMTMNHKTRISQLRRHSRISIHSNLSSTSFFSDSSTHQHSDGRAMTPFEVVKRRIDKTIKCYEESNQAHNKSQQSEEEVFLEKIMERLDKVKHYMLRIDIAMLVDRHRRLLDRYGVSKNKNDEEVGDEQIDEMLNDMDEWVARCQDIGQEADDIEAMDDVQFEEMCNVDRELMVEGDLQRLKEKFAKLYGVKNKIKDAGHQEAVALEAEKEALQAEVAAQIQANNAAKSNNQGFLNAADEIFHLMEKARAEGGGKEAAQYQQEVAQVLKELVKRDQLASGQSKKMKQQTAELEKMKTDYTTIMSDHKSLKAEYESQKERFEMQGKDLANLKQKLLKLQKSNKDMAGKGSKDDSSKVHDQDSKKISALQENTKKMEETIKMMEQKLLFLQEDNEQKDSQVRELEQTLTTVRRTTVAANQGALEKVDKNKNQKKDKKKLKNDQSKPNLAKDESVNSEVIEKLKKELEIAQRNEQLITKSLKKKESDLKSTEEKMDQIKKKLDFQSRELETTKASLELVKKQSARASNETSQAKTTLKTDDTKKTMKSFCGQTENICKSVNTQCTIPLELICISDIENGRNSSLPSLNLTNIIQILQCKAGIKDVCSLVKYFKKSNEKEIKTIQAHLSGGAPNSEVPNADLSDLGDVGGGGEIVVDSQAMKDVETKARDTAVSFVQASDAISKRLRESVMYFRDSLGGVLDKNSKQFTQMAVIEESVEEVQEDLYEIVPGLREREKKNSNQSLRAAGPRKNPINKKLDNARQLVFYQKAIESSVKSISPHDFKVMGNKIQRNIIKTVEEFGNFVVDEFSRVNNENRNLRKRLANNKNMMNSHENFGVGGHDGYAGDDHNPDHVLDDIQNMLESRLNTVRRRTSTVNFSSLISGKSIGGVQVKNRNLLTSQRKRGDSGRDGGGAGSIKSEPIPKRVSVVRRQPSVMSVMRSMNPINQTSQNMQNSNQNIHSNIIQNSQNSNNPHHYPTSRQSNQSLSIGNNNNQRKNTNNNNNNNSQRPMTMHGTNTDNNRNNQSDNQKWLGRFEREFQQTKLRSQRAKGFHQLDNNNRPRTMGGGFDTSRRQRGGATGGQKLENILTSTSVNRNKLNPVFGTNLPRSQGRRFR